MASPNVVDPHHFILFQHGVLGYAGDFDNVIEDVLIDHHLALEESRQLSRESAGAKLMVSCSYQDFQSLREASRQRQQQQQRQAAAAAHNDPDSPLGSGPFHAPTVSTGATTSFLLSSSELQKRRAEARQTFRLTPEYRGSGRVYEAGNLTLFSPGSNNWLRTNAGIHACTKRSMTEFLPIFREWLSTVESAEAERFRRHQRLRQRQAKRKHSLAPFSGRATADGGEMCDAADRIAKLGSASLTAAAAAAATVSPKGGTNAAAASLSGIARGDSWAGFSLPSAANTLAPSSGDDDFTIFDDDDNTNDGLDGQHEDYTPTPICFSCLGHSFGGLILREFLFLLLTNEEQGDLGHDLFQEILAVRQHMQRAHVTFENFTTLATPHCGVSECLWWPFKIGAYCLDKLRIFPTYGELLTTDTVRQLRSRMLDHRHLLALRVFRRRTLFANTQRDLLVGFGTSSLIFEDVDDDHTKARGFQRPLDAFCASAFETDQCEVSAPIYLPRYSAQRLDVDDENGRHKSNQVSKTDIAADAGGPDREARVNSTGTLERATSSLLNANDANLSVAEVAERDAAADKRACETFPPQFPAPRYISPLMPRHTYDDLVEILTRPASPVAEGLTGNGGSLPRWERSLPPPPSAPTPPPPPTQPASAPAATVLEGVQDSNASLPSPIARRMADTTTASTVDDEVTATALSTPLDFHFFKPPEAPAPDDFIIRAVVQEHRQLRAERDEDAQQQQQQHRSSFVSRHLPWRYWTSGEGRANTADADPAAYSELDMHDATTEAMDALDSYARMEAAQQQKRPPRTRFGRPASADASVRSLGELALLTSAGPRPLLGRFTGWLLDVPLNLLTDLWRRVRGGSGSPRDGKDDGESSGSEDAYNSTTTAPDDGDDGNKEHNANGSGRPRDRRNRRRGRGRGRGQKRNASVIFAEHAKQLPAFVEMPRSIAYHLRKHLDWRVRAIRYKNRIPIAHVACLGNWAWAGQSPDVVQSVAEEVLRIL